MKNRKGFTLIEIIAAIIIIGVLAIITIPAVTKYVTNTRNTTYDAHEISMKSAAESKIVTCISGNDTCDLPGVGEKRVIYLSELIDGGYIDKLQDGSTGNFCSADESYVEVENLGNDNYEYKSCLFCSSYKTGGECEELNTDSDLPMCEVTTGESTEWTSESRTITVNCGDETSGCTKDSFSKTFGSTTKTGSILIRDKSGNSNECNVNVYVDKTAPTCSLKITSGSLNGGWYTGNVVVGMDSKNDGESGMLSYGMGTELKNKNYDGSTTFTVNKDGLITVYGYVKDKVGNEGYCAIDVPIAKSASFDVEQGFQIYPSKESYELKDIEETGSTLKTKATDGTITISGLKKYGRIRRIVIYFNSPINNTTTMRVKYNGKDSSSLLVQGSKKASIQLDEGSYESVDIVLGTLNEETYSINRIEVRVKDPSNIYTNKDVNVGLEPSTSGMALTGYSFDNGSTFQTDNYKGYGSNQVVATKVKDGTGVISETKSTTIGGIDKISPTCVVNGEGTTGTNGWFKKNTKIVFISSSDSGSGVSLFGVDDYSSTSKVVTKEGADQVFRGKVLDKAGNEGTCSVNIKYDSVAPKIEIEKVSESSYLTTKKIKIKMSDETSGLSTGQSVQYGWSSSSSSQPTAWNTLTVNNASGVKTYDALVDVTGMDDIAYLWIKTITFKDVAGNTTNGYVTKSDEAFRPDSVGPKMVLDKEGESTYSKTKTVNVTITDSTGIKSGMQVKAGWSTSKTVEPTNYETLNVTGYSNGDKKAVLVVNKGGLTGSYYLFIKPVVVEDVLGNKNVNTLVSQQVFNFDNTSPTYTLVKEQDTSYSINKTVGVIIGDSNSGIKGNAKIEYGWSTSKTTPPTTLYDSRVSYTEGAKTATFNATGTNLDGSYYLWIVKKDFKDVAGNEAGANKVSTGVFAFDNTAPTITLAKNTETVYSKSQSVQVNLCDNLSGVYSGRIKYGWTKDYSVRPTSLTTVTITAGQTMFTAQGSGFTGHYYLWIEPDGYSDKAGNIATATVKSTGTFAFDNTPPEIRGIYTNPAQSTWTKDSVTIHATVEDKGIGLKKYCINTKCNDISGSVKDISETFTDNGTYTITVTDVLGNESSVTTTIANIDNGKLTSSVKAYKTGTTTEVATDTWSNKTLDYVLTLNGTALADYTHQYMVSTSNSGTPNNLLGNGTRIKIGNIPAGAYTNKYYFRYNVTSVTGVVGDVKSFYAKVDQEGPTCRITGNPTSWTNGNVTLTVSATDVNSGSGVNANGYYWGDGTHGTTLTVTKNGTYTAHATDNVGNVGPECSVTVTKIDKTAPTCSIAVTDGTAGTNGWYKSQKVTLSVTNDDKGDNTTPSYASGVNTYGVINSSSTTYNSQNKYVINKNTSGITVYCYVKDNAGNTNSNSITIKKDDGYIDSNITETYSDDAITKSTISCDYTGNSTWTNSNITLKAKLHQVPLSGCVDTNCEQSWTFSSDAMTTSVSGKVFTTKAGSVISCQTETVNTYLDKTVPSCGTITGASTTWTNGNRTISAACSDNLSGCTQTSYSNTWSSTTKTSSLTIRDNAGNTNTCNVNVYVDKIAPSCGTITGASNLWTYNNRTISVACSDSNSGCTQDSYSKTWSTDTKTGSLTIEDKAGNTNTCDFDVYVDKTAPTCEIVPGYTGWTNTDSFTLTLVDNDGLSGVPSGAYDWGSGYSNTSVLTVYNNGTYTGTVRDTAGNTKSCSYNVSNFDRTGPTCSVSVSNKGTTSGVSTSVTCSDSQSGCKSSNPTGDTGLTASKTYTVYDNVGNSGTCSVTVSSQRQSRTASCSTYNSCQNSGCTCATGKRCASAGCEIYNSCADSSCGCKSWRADYSYTYNQPSGASSSGSLASGSTSKQAAENYCGNSMSSYCGAYEYGCASSSCKGVCEGNKSCPNSNCTCNTYYQSISSCGCASYNSCRVEACGCETWGNWSGWSNVSSCTESSSNSSKTGCRTVYN